MKNLILLLSFMLISVVSYAQWELISIDLEDIPTYYHVDFRDSQKGLVLSSGFKILKTIDGGISWDTIITNDFQIADFEYMGGDTILGLGSREEGQALYWSYDDGFTWELSEEILNENLYKIRRNDSLILIGGNRKIYRSNELGLHLTEVFNIEDEGYMFGEVPNIFQTSDSIIYASGIGLDGADSLFKSFILKSVNQGLTWEIKREKIDFSLISPAIYFSNDTVGFYISSTAEEAFHSTIHSTTDGGETWIETIQEQEEGVFDISFPSDSIGYIISGGGAIGFEAIFYFFSISKSLNGGETWEHQFLNNSGAPLRSIDFVSDSIGYVVGDFGVILKTVTCGGEMDENYPWDYFIVDTEDLNVRNQVEIFPNPADSKITIEIEDEKTGQGIRVHAIDSQGRLLSSNNYGIINRIELDITDFPSGLILLYIESDNFKEIHKLIKN